MSRKATSQPTSPRRAPSPAARRSPAATARRRASRRGKGFALPRPRLLPLLIVVAMVVVTVRLGGIWQDVSLQVIGLRLERAEAQAQEVGQEAPPPAAQPAAEPPAAVGEPGSPVPTAALTGALQSPPQADDPARDPIGFTQSEIEVLQKLAERREELEQREQSLAVQEALLQAAEERLDRRVEELRQLESRINDLVKTHDDQEQARLDRLVKVYTSMKPKDAARIFNGLDMPILLDLFEIMQERKAAPILAEMSADKARLLTEELSRRKDLPEAGEPLVPPEGAAGNG
ncbi:MotE family protein [Roseospirillum parvum]|uniref:MgtE intracellular N domain-containing protein n=1 Tax=Roseospirillum parvum TaxID=83401 RepID=A0A1G8FG62_9PROT|nr:hypothetical protein [Roseospirillum parvum]SDH81151.1 MgtE intracellular N domain-containing protein [Roseospirillum parvum]